jgi:excisionase family DNA binding protein
MVTADIMPLVVRPKDACKLLSCSHRRLYELIMSGEVESYLDGRARRILVASISAYVERKLNQTKSRPGTARFPGGQNIGLSNNDGLHLKSNMRQ